MNEEFIVIGSNGFIGKHLCKAIQPKYHTARKDAPYHIDLKAPSLDTIPTQSLRYAIIAAACANITHCETHLDETHQINVEGTLKLTKLLLDKGIFPVLFSSDYVFSGKKGDYLEGSSLGATTVYGRQKAELESRIHNVSGGNHLILRLSKIYSLERDDGTLLDEMAKNLTEGLSLKAATDQIFCPLVIDDLVAVILKLIENNHKGLLNLGGKDKVSRFQLAEKLAITLDVSKGNVHPIQLNELNPLVSRPTNTSLISEKVFDLLDYTPISIDHAIKAVSNNYQD
ncbi:MAG: sugar nucleotide-binding protein [Candidatus Neptunochlamydia sp.]|nr:sugar nucleotide-binding protein [Candidatus Neptunochlamydia sp.]